MFNISIVLHCCIEFDRKIKRAINARQISIMNVKIKIKYNLSRDGLRHQSSGA